MNLDEGDKLSINHEKLMIKQLLQSSSHENNSSDCQPLSTESNRAVTNSDQETSPKPRVLEVAKVELEKEQYNFQKNKNSKSSAGAGGE